MFNMILVKAKLKVSPQTPQICQALSTANHSELTFIYFSIPPPPQTAHPLPKIRSVISFSRAVTASLFKFLWCEKVSACFLFHLPFLFSISLLLLLFSFISLPLTISRRFVATLVQRCYFLCFMVGTTIQAKYSAFLSHCIAITIEDKVKDI